MKNIATFFPLLFLLGCVDSIPGHPEKVIARYAKGVQMGHYETIFSLRHVTARQLKFMRVSKLEEDRTVLAMQIEAWRSAYEKAPAGYDAAQRWNDKNIFLPGATVVVAAPYEYKAVGDDPVNAEYIKGSKVIVPVEISYAKKMPLLYGGERVWEARFDCILGKIRDLKTVRTYSHDERWYVTACLIDAGSLSTSR